jgi:ligand-binding SRPBCC domain-containing protein
MGSYQLIKEQKIPAELQEVWDFISVPANLKKITPSYMGFDITSKNLPEKMHEGMIISYNVKPILGINTLWVTEITHMKENNYFVDEQRVGPYKMWHHEHYIEAIKGGVLMKDMVSYQPPLGFLGSLANTLFIKNQLEKIFTYRTVAMEQLFGRY